VTSGYVDGVHDFRALPEDLSMREIRFRCSRVVRLAIGIVLLSSCSSSPNESADGSDDGGSSSDARGDASAASGGFGNGGGDGSGNGNGSGNGSGADGGGNTGDATLDGGPACAAAVTPGAIALTDHYLSASVIADGGYAFAYSDGTSTACIAEAALCALGSTSISSPTVYGAGIGFNLNQAMATGATSPPLRPFAATGAGLSYRLSNLPSQGVRLAIGNFDGTSGTDYCAVLSASSGTVAWGQFNSKCWDDSGTFLVGPPVDATHIAFQIPAAAAVTPFDFCVDSVAFASTISAPDGGVATTCSGGACCEPSGGPAAKGNGIFTCYTFSQGTVNNKTFCGYEGSESAGPGGSGACQSGALSFSDTVPNVGTNPHYFAAFPSGSFGQGLYCGMCVDVSYGGHTLMATIVDECATCGDSPEHIDLSADLARDLGVGVGGAVGNPSGVSWAAVACPISASNGHIVAVWNNHDPSSGQVYFQNTVFPVTSVSGSSQSYGFWSNIANGSTHTLTDMLGHHVTATVVSGDLGVQFPATCP
jgi:hypothetical protein